MPLRIFDRTADSAAPDSVGAVQQWIKNLPQNDMTALARELLAGLQGRDWGRYPTSEVLTILQNLHPAALTVLYDLRARLARRAYPLPAGIHKAVQTRQAILDRLAADYRRIAQQTRQPLDRNRQALCVHHALRLRGEQLLTAAQFYAPLPNGFWREGHELYRAAEALEVLDHPVAEIDPGSAARSTIREAWLRLCLLSLARPQSLRQGEAEALAQFFAHAAAGCQVSATPPARAKTVYAVDTNADDPPHFHTAGSATATGDAVRYLDLDHLVEALKARIRDKPTPAAATPGPPLDVELCRHLLDRLTTPVRRHFSRRSRNQPIRVVIGLNGIHRMLEPAPGGTPADVTEAAPWRLIDTGAGGYRLAWESAAASAAAVGEPLALCETLRGEEPWRIGAIRHLRCSGNRRLEVGVQLLAPRGFAATLARERPDDSRQSGKIKILMLSAVRSVDQPPTLLAPPGSLRPGETAILALNGYERRVELTDVGVQSHAFAQFLYTYLD